MVVFFKSVLELVRELVSDGATYRAVPLFSEGQLKNYDNYYSYSVFKTPFGHPCYLGVQTKGGLRAWDDYEG